MSSVKAHKQTGEPRLVNRADGVKGHYCIARTVYSYWGDYAEFWNEGDKWSSAGEVFIGEEAAKAKLAELSQTSD